MGKWAPPQGLKGSNSNTKIKMIWDISYCLMSPLMFYIALCCTIIPCAFIFEDPRVNSLFVAVLTSDCNVFLLKHFFPRVYVPCSAGVGAWVCQGNVFDGQSEGDGVVPVVRLLRFRLIVDCPRQNPSNVFVQEFVGRTGQYQILSFNGHFFQTNMESTWYICQKSRTLFSLYEANEPKLTQHIFPPLSRSLWTSQCRCLPAQVYNLSFHTLSSSYSYNFSWSYDTLGLRHQLV